ncbi:MAG: SpoIIE family protein phosphatase [Ruminococcus sp.]|jgi:sigma-B regulation protein RsbU (phosphoserine phosphatase)|nr:SpoIIE family protein phosphatase [Ruminococcus sp.]
MFHKIKTRIIVLMLIISVLPLLVVGVVSWRTMTLMKQSITSVSEQMGSTAANSSTNTIRSDIRAYNLAVAKLTAQLVTMKYNTNGNDIADLADVIGDSVDEGTRTFLVNRDGNLIYDKEGNYVNGEMNFNDMGGPGEKFIARSAATVNSGSEIITYHGERIYFAYAPCGDMDYSVGVLTPVEGAERDAVALRDSLIVLNNAINAEVNRNFTYGLTITFIAVAVAAFDIIIMATRFSKNITKPIEQLTEEVSKIGNDYTISSQINIRTGDELEALADSYNLMTERLRGFISELEKSTADKERARAELSVVKDIRDTAFPHIVPGYLERTEIDIYGTTKDVAGTNSAFYNYFPSADDRIVIIASEVSGSGIAAAVMMLIAKTLMEQGARNGKTLEEIFYTVNNILFEKRKTEHSVRAFLGYLDLKNGELNYITAGLHSPFIKTFDKKWEQMPIKPNNSLALADSVRYESETRKLNWHDRIFIYSDSVLKMLSESGDVYSKDNLCEALNRSADMDIQEICDNVYNDISAFTDGKIDADVSMLIAEYIGKL